MRIDKGNQLVGANSWRNGSDSIIIDLTADQNECTIDGSMIQIAFMSGGGKIFLGQNVDNHCFSETSSFRMTLESTLDRNNIGGAIKMGTEAFEIPRCIRIVNL
jgi:hypothetical protein